MSITFYPSREGKDGMSEWVGDWIEFPSFTEASAHFIIIELGLPDVDEGMADVPIAEFESACARVVDSHAGGTGTDGSFLRIAADDLLAMARKAASNGATHVYAA